MSILINDVDISDPRGFALRICENLKYSLKVDVAPILMATHMLESDRIKKVAEMLAEAAFIRAYDNQWEEFLAPATDDAVCGDFKDDAHHLTLGASSVEIEPNLALTQADADYLKGLTGDDVKKYP